MNATEPQEKRRPDMKDLDAGIHFQIFPEGMDSPVVSVYVGMKKNDYFVVTPYVSEDGNLNLLEPEQPVTVHCLFNNQFLEFQSKVIEVVSHPVDLMLLEYPGTLQAVQRRAHQRINCFISAEITLEVENSIGCVKGVIKNISKGGCLYLTRSGGNEKDICRIGESIALRCRFPGIVGEQETIGTVVGIQKAGEDTTIRIQFPEPLWWIPPYSNN